MNLSINLGNWNSVFAVPSLVVDKHIKLAGSAQLKVLLFILRHAGNNISIDKISESLSMDKADVKDALQYWIETKVISLNNNTVSPADISNMQQEKVKEINKEEIQSLESTELNEHKSDEKVARRPIRPPKPDNNSVSQRINDSPEIAFLMQEAQVILSRPISNSDSSTLLMLHDTDGLPVDVIIMLMQYAVSIGKGNMKYIEKMAISWSNEEIDTIEKAESKIRLLESYRKAWNSVEKIIGIDHRSPTSKEDQAASKWINTWKISDELIKEAYERCVNAKGRYILGYMDSIIKRWHDSGITHLSQAMSESKKLRYTYSKSDDTFPSYDIDEYERKDMFI